jgi:hypothetical protein
MSDKISKNEESQVRRFNQEQYDILKRCSDKKDMTEWNQWRKNNPEKDIELEGADFSRWYLKEVHLNGGRTSTPLWNAGTIIPDNSKELPYELSGNVFLNGAKFFESHLEWADLRGAHLNLADFCGTHLYHARFQKAYLQGSEFFQAEIEKASFALSEVDGSTVFWSCKTNCDTDFRGVALGSCRVEQGIRQLLEYNIRRINWEQWYEKGSWLKRFLKKLFIKRFFWALSDYGRSTWRIIIWFFGLAFAFAGIYYLCALMNPPGIVNSLIEGKEGLVPARLLPFRSIYFSIVTMTTLGFGDMHANCQSFWGHLLLTFQVILGYVLLGALVTRFAVLFTAGGPAGEFADEKEKKEYGEKTKKE